MKFICISEIKHEDELPSLVSVEETVIIKPSDNAKKKASATDDIIEVEADQVKYHSGQTPHPNRVDPEKMYQAMSEAEDNIEDEIIEVNPGDVHYHEAVQKQVGLLVPSKPRHESKSPSPHLAIISDFIDSRREKEQKKMMVKESIEKVSSTSSSVMETAVVTTVHVQQASQQSLAASSSLIEDSLTKEPRSGALNLSAEKSDMSKTFEGQMTQQELVKTQNETCRIDQSSSSTVQECSSSSTCLEQTEHMSFHHQNFQNEVDTLTVQEESSKIESHQMTTQSNELISDNLQELDDKYVMDKNETQKMEELFDKLVADESDKFKSKPTQRSRSFDAIEKWLMNSETSNSFEAQLEVKQDESKAKLAQKRLRNKTIDFSSLPNNAGFYNVTATCSSKTYNTPKIQSQASTESEPDSSSSGLSGRKPGLCLIIDKLKSIETKLDELKTLDCQEQNFAEEEMLKKDDFLEQTVKTVQDNHEEDDDNTLKDDLDKSDEVNSQATDISHTTEIFVDEENIVISSPVATPAYLDKTKTSTHLFNKKNHVDIMSIHTMSEVDTHDEADDEDEDDISSGRQSRIEMLAKKIMEEEEKLAQIERQRRHSSAQEVKRDPINLNAELDTVSERSEIEDDSSLAESLKQGNDSFAKR